MTGQQGLPEPPPEAALIRRARQARGLTRAEAAERSSVVKASRWGQIENGYLMKDGVPMPTKAGDMQLAHMARAVGVTPERLEEAGRGTAAEILREIIRQEQESAAEPVYADLSNRLESAVWGMDLSLDDRKAMVDLLRQARAEGRDSRSA